ncbi:MAG: peptidyl-prolyl cis-trans isomerase SurA [Candidatus Endobugula sp.]|jgi:peptidyl-prolyl cis-trans isomerase SurA
MASHLPRIDTQQSTKKDQIMLTIKTRFNITSPLNGLTLALSLLISSHAFSYQAIDKTVAIVGEDIIFFSELGKKIKDVKIRSQNKQKTTNENVLRKQALNALILEKLQLKIAKKNNISASKKEVDATISKTDNNLKRKGTSFKQYLLSQELTINDAKEEIEKEIIINKIQQGAINQRINITEREIDNFLSSKEGLEWLTPRFHIGQIFLNHTSKNKESILNQAKKIHKNLQNTKNSFNDIARKYSQGPNANKGGDIGILTQEDMPELFTQKLIGLRAGQLSAPFYSDAGVHILKLFSRTGAEPVIVEQHKVRHILVKANKLFTEEEAKEKIDRLYQRLNSGEAFTTLAQENTDDIGSKVDGGNLGWSLPGKFVPSFERTVLATPVGEISKPFLSEFGWHILRVDEKRKKDIFENVKRQQVTKILRRQRFQDELQIWLKELRDNTYVEILI